MVLHAANTTAQPNSSLKAPSMAIRAYETCDSMCSKPSFYGVFAALGWAAVLMILHRRNHRGDFGALEFLPPRIPSSARSLLRGQTGALRLGVVLLRLQRPCGVSVPPRTSLKAAAKSATQTSSGPRQESTPWHLGAGPTRSLR